MYDNNNDDNLIMIIIIILNNLLEVIPYMFIKICYYEKYFNFWYHHMNAFVKIIKLYLFTYIRVYTLMP